MASDNVSPMQPYIKLIKNIFFDKKLLNVLLVLLNVLTASIAFGLASRTIFPDAQNYIDLAESIFNGNFSSVCGLSSCLPDTVRTPGYPLILSAFFYFSHNLLLIKLAQLLFYFITLRLGYLILMKISNNNLINGNIFLLFTAFNIQIPYYSGSISSETFTTFLVVLFFYRLIVKDGNQLWKDALVSGMVLGSLYYLRPGFLLFPFILLGLSIFRGLNLNPKFISMQIFFFVLLLLPFGTWNYMNHGVFKISPIGVSGMVALNGYWYFKLPHGYVNTYMWNEVVVPDVTNPFPNIKREKELNRLDYESRWDNFLDSKDIMVDCIGNDEELLAYKNQKTCKSSFSKFILERERFVKNELFSLAWQNKWTYLSERSYSFFRLFFTGINIHKIEKNEGLSKKIMRIYPFLITFGSIFLGFFLSLLVTPKLARSEFNAFIPMLAIVLYVAASHAVFPIQARYLIPMHMLILIMTSISILKFFAYLSSKRARTKN